jgi:hypothetical protein
MNTNIIAAVLHLREASNLLKDIHPELSDALLKTAMAFVSTDADMDEVRRMEEAAAETAAGADGSAG